MRRSGVDTDVGPYSVADNNNITKGDDNKHVAEGLSRVRNTSVFLQRDVKSEVAACFHLFKAALAFFAYYILKAQCLGLPQPSCVHAVPAWYENIFHTTLERQTLVVHRGVRVREERWWGFRREAM